GLCGSVGSTFPTLHDRLARDGREWRVSSLRHNAFQDVVPLPSGGLGKLPVGACLPVSLYQPPERLYRSDRSFLGLYAGKRGLILCFKLRLINERESDARPFALPEIEFKLSVAGSLSRDERGQFARHALRQSSMSSSSSIGRSACGGIACSSGISRTRRLPTCTTGA